MWIINLYPAEKGVHSDHRADHITAPPEGWAMIPDDFPVPSTYPRLGSIEAEELTYTREVEVQREIIKTRGVPQYDEIDGALVEVGIVTEEYTELETVMETQEYTMMTVTAMTEGTLPEETTPEPTQLDIIEAQVTYTALMTDTLLGG